MQRQKEQERKDRTKRLIERGAILESLVPGAAEYTNEQIKAFLEKTVGSDSAHKILVGLASQGDVLDAAQPSAPPPQRGAKARGKSASTEQGRTYIPPTVVSCAPAEGVSCLLARKRGNYGSPCTP